MHDGGARCRGPAVRWVAVALVVLGLSGAYAAEHLGYYEDVEGTVPLEQVPDAPFTPVERGVARGYGDLATVHWFEVRVVPDVAERWYLLHLRPHHVDDVRLYELRGGGLRHVETVGMYADAVSDPRNPGLAGFVLEPGPAPATYFVAISTRDSMAVSMQVLGASEARRVFLRTAVLSIAYVALALAAIFATVASFAFHRDPIFLAFAVAQAVWLASFTLLEGYPVFGSVWGAPVGPAFDVSIPLATLAANLFHGTVFARYGTRRFAAWGFGPWAATSAVAATLVAAGFVTAGLQVNGVAVVATPFVQLIGAASLLERHPRPNGVIVAYAVLGLVTLGWVGSLVGATQPSPLTEWAPLAYGISTLALMFSIVVQFEREAYARLHEAERQVQAWRARRDAERRARAQRVEVLDAIDHDVRNAFGVIGMNVPWSGLPPKARSRSEAAFHAVEQGLDRMRQLEARADQAADEGPWERRYVVAGLRELVMQRYATSDAVAVTGDRSLAVRVDPYAFENAFGELLDNAAKYAAPGTRPAVSVQRRPGAGSGATWIASVCVSNDVSHDAALDVERVFDRHYRGDHGASLPGEGMGLGVARSFVHRLGGTIEVTFEKGVFEVWIRLPAEA
ncbi:MAG: 7TM-DISM domain-containing protein [Trueperaceae bacterium]|nr:7TM-DISM domain-containing protein [Trueperaceae bacterium]